MLLAGVSALALTTAAEPVGAATSDHVVVVSGLNNPRQLDLVRDDLLLVAEAGRGGPTDIGGDLFAGPSGSVSALLHPASVHDQRPSRIVTGLLSVATRQGRFADGANGVAAASVFGPVYTAITWTPRRFLPTSAERVQSGALMWARWFGRPAMRADIAGYERAHDPDGRGAASDPAAVLALPDGSQLVADAVGNDVLRIAPDGRRSVFHVFPRTHEGQCGRTGCNYVPTALARDAQGRIYVGGYGAEPFRIGAVTVLSPDGRRVLRTIRGLSSVAGVAVDRFGTVYATDQFADTGHRFGGRLVVIAADGHRRTVPVPLPSGVAVDHALNVYVATFSIAPSSGGFGPGTSGQIWRLRL